MERTHCLLTGSEIVQQHRAGIKELPEVGVKLFEPSGSWFEGNKLNGALDERYSLLNEPRIERDTLLSVAKWDAEKKKVVIIKKRGKEYETYGHHDSIENLDYLNPEEALFLLESNSLTLFHGNVEVSMEISYSLLLSQEAGCTLDQYRVFSHLSRLGYKLIRHKKPETENKSDAKNSCPKDNMIVIDDDTSIEVIEVDRPCNRSKRTRKTKPTAKEDIVVLIESSDSDDDVEIVDEFDGSLSRDIIQIGDDDSRDSDLVVVETLGQMELPLENWSYVPRWKFLGVFRGDGLPVIVDALVLSQREVDILDELPNIKGRKAWLYRPEDILIPDGVWPFHYKYLIDLCEERNNNRGRGGYRGRGFRGRGWHLQRQVSQMKDYTISLMNVVSQLMGGHGGQVLPPPPSFFSGPNFGNNRGIRPRGRATWGRISLNTRGSNYRPSHHTETVELSDDEEETSRPKRPSSSDDNEDIESKRVKLDPDEMSNDSDSSIKSEPMDIKVEVDIKEEDTDDIKPNISSLDDFISIKSETNSVKSETVSIKSETEIKTEIISEEKDKSSKTKNRENQQSQNNNLSLEKVKDSRSEIYINIDKNYNNADASSSAGSSHISEFCNLALNIKDENSAGVKNNLKSISTKVSKAVETLDCIKMEDLPDSNIKTNHEDKTEGGKKDVNSKSVNVFQSSSTHVSKGTVETECIEMKELPESNCGMKTSNADEDKTERANEDENSGSMNDVSQSSSTNVPVNSDCVEMKEVNKREIQLSESNCGTKINNEDKSKGENKDENSGSMNVVSQSSSTYTSNETVTSDCVEMKELVDSNSKTNHEDKTAGDKKVENSGNVNVVSQSSSTNVSKEMGNSDCVEMKVLPNSNCDTKTNNEDKTKEENKDENSGSANVVSQSSITNISKETVDPNYVEMKKLPESNFSCVTEADDKNVEIKDSNLENQHIMSKSISSDVSKETVTSDCVEMKELPETLNITKTNVEENLNNSDQDEENVTVVSKSDVSKDTETSDSCKTKIGDECKDLEISTCVEMKELPESHCNETNVEEVSKDKILEDENIVSMSASTNVLKETDGSENIEIKELPKTTSETKTEVNTKVENNISNLKSTNIVSQSITADFSKATEDSVYIEMNELSQSNNKTEINNKDNGNYDNEAKYPENDNVSESVSSNHSKESGFSAISEIRDSNLTENIKVDEIESSSKLILLSDDSSTGDKISSPIKTRGKPILVSDNSMEITENSLANEYSYNKEAEDSEKQSADGSAKPDEHCDKTTSWKELKENEKSILSVQGDNVTSMEEDEVGEVPYGKPLIEEKHCKSLGDVLKRLQIFGQYESKNELKRTDLVEVKYDVYLPTSNYYRHLPADPDFRLVILNLDDNLPDAEEMRCLRQLYNDKKSFLFAVTLRESIAYYQYDTVFIPVNSDPS